MPSPPASPRTSPRKATPPAQNRRSEAFEIRTLAAGLSALVLLLTVDLERDVTRNNREAARLRLAVAALASAWAPMLTLVAGNYAHPLHWKYVQPFAGGAGFVVMQAAGWMLHASTLCAFLVSFMNFDKALLAPPGAALVLGAAAATSQLTLNVSIDRFRATTQETLAHGEKNSALSALSGMLVGAAVALSALADRTLSMSLGKRAAPALVISACGCLGLAALTTHAVHGPLVRKHYAPWMPFRGGPRFVLLHACAWTLVGVLCDVLLAVGPTSVAYVKGGPLAMCTVGGVANAALMSSLDYFDGSQQVKASMETPSSLVVARLFILCALIGYYTPVFPDEWIMGTGAPAAYVTATLLAHAAPVLAHVGASRNIAHYRLFMVGEGGSTFVITQGCGWMMYAFSLLFSGATVVTKNTALGTFASPLAVISAGVLVASVSLFEHTQDESEEQPRELWHVKCAASAFDDLDAAAEDLYVLRETAKTPASRALLRAAAQALESAAAERRTAMTTDEEDEPVALGCTLDADGGIMRRRKQRHALLVKALPIVAAPSATALGALLLHAAEHTRGHYAPLLAACALLSTLFAAPLQFMNKRAQPFAHTASLAAWSFAVLAALLAVLRPREGSMPLAACGWVGVFLQGLALALGGGTPVHKRSSSKYLRKLESLSVDTRSTGTVLDAPEDVWQRIERHLVSRDLGALASTAKAPQWCTAYTTPQRWRKRLKQLAAVEPTCSDVAIVSPRAGLPPRRHKDRGTLDWKFACYLRDRGAPLLRCCRCGDVDAIANLEDIRLAPCARCGRASAAHRRCLEKNIVRPVLGSDVRGEDVGSCPACGTALDAGTRAPCNVAEFGACVWHDGSRLRRAVLRVCADALLVYVACSKLQGRNAFVDQCGREPDTLRPIFVVWLTLQVALLRVVRSDAYSETLMHIWQHRGSVARYLALYGFHVVAFVANMVAFLPWGAPRCASAPLFEWSSFLMLALGTLVSAACLGAFERTTYLVLTVADLAEPPGSPTATARHLPPQR